MIATAFAAVVGATVAGTLWLMGSEMFAVPALQRENYRGESVVTATGVLIPVTLMLVVGAGHLTLVAWHRAPVWYELGWVSLLCAAAFGLLGLIDDVAGAGQSGGYRGHLKALRSARISTGALKLVAGGAVGVLVAASVPSTDVNVVAALRDGAIVALSANLVNLLDRAPGRCIKFSGVALAAALLVARSPLLAAPAVGIGAGIGLLWSDLREHAMVGDAGANPLGALVGLAWLVALPSPLARWCALAGLVGCNLLSEVVSFSDVIDAFAPLRWFDRLGSLRGH